MIRWYSTLVALIWTFSLYGQSDDYRNFLPPYHFSVDSVSLLATWESPKMILLEEDFEGDDFPPANWTATSLGKGWTMANDPELRFWSFPVPPGNFALNNDDSAQYNNDGSMDYLITPVLDLTVADSFLLIFDSYFDGAYGQRAFVEYSLDSGLTWQLLQQIDANLEWQTTEVDLSEFSGMEGESDIQFAFHADDYGYWASGWAVDNVVVYSNQNPNQLIKYKVFLDSELLAQVTSTSYQYDFEFTSIHNCGILARYQDGLSDTVWQNVCSSYFPKPDSLTGYAPDDGAILDWAPPANSDYLIGYNLYRNGMLRAYIYCTEPECCYYFDPFDWYEGSYFNYEITALYELSEYGFPGEIGESVKEGPAQITGCCYNELDFFEDWDNSTHHWKFSDNWFIDTELGNEAPAAVFSPDTVLISYQDSLQTFMFATFGLGTLDIILEFDVSLSSVISSGDEKLFVQVYDFFNQAWNTVMTYDNAAGSFGWHRDTINITNVFNDSGFMIRFKTLGENSADINYWAIDNIAVRMEINPPKNVEAIIAPTSEDSVLVSWEEPLPEIADWWQWDDGEQYEKVGFGIGKGVWAACAVRWTQEQLAELKYASLTSVGFIPTNDSYYSTFYKIAIWTGDDRDLVYTQATGNLILDQWNYISLDEPIKVDITKELLVGYLYSQTGGFSMSVDAGPAVEGFGNLVSFGLDWQTLTQINPELSYNWNIKAYFERDGVPAETYQLFRSLDGNEPIMIAEVDNLEYVDTVSSGYVSSCYKLKSVFPSGLMSDFSEEACVIFTNTDPVEPENDGFLKIYPNPASKVLFIESSEEIKSVRILDSRGIILETWNAGTLKHWNNGTLAIPVSDLVPGLYLVKVETFSGTVGKKVIIR